MGFDITAHSSMSHSLRPEAIDLKQEGALIHCHYVVPKPPIEAEQVARREINGLIGQLKSQVSGECLNRDSCVGFVLLQLISSLQC